MKIITKTILTIVAILFANACATTSPTMKSVAGEYKGNKGNTFDGAMAEYLKYVFLENGVFEQHINGGKGEVAKWSIVDGEIQVKYRRGSIQFWRINADKSITLIAEQARSRKDYSKEIQPTYKKIK